MAVYVNKLVIFTSYAARKQFYPDMKSSTRTTEKKLSFSQMIPSAHVTIGSSDIHQSTPLTYTSSTSTPREEANQANKEIESIGHDFQESIPDQHNHLPSKSRRTLASLAVSNVKRKALKRKKSPREGNSKRTLFWRFNPALVLENAGSVARDHLASERTFLAYVRTSLALASTGVAVVQLFAMSNSTVTDQVASRILQKFARPLGATAVVIALLVLLIGSVQVTSSDKNIF